MLTSNDGTTTSYLINFMGQRTKKSNSSSTTWFIYDENDNVIAEYDASGSLVDEYVYMDNRPLALIRSSNLYYIYTDHLNTPRAITDTSNNLQWTWENKEAFGNNDPVEVVSGFKFNFRFSGQYFDSETNLNYNIHRDYNPVWGRYVQSDPLGLSAGVSTYGYVGGNSLGYSDRLGLIPSLPQEIVDISAALGDNLFGLATFGLGDGSSLRSYLNIDGANENSSTYKVSNGLFLIGAIIAPLPNNKPKIAYSVLYEVRLAQGSLIGSRPNHFKMCNEALIKDMNKNTELGQI